VINVAALAALAFAVALAAGLDGVRDVVVWLLVPAGAALAGYTALLFNQLEGRDLWQSRLLLPHTIAAALLAGAAALAVVTGGDGVAWVMAGAALVTLAFVLADALGRHPTAQAEQAARNLTRTLYARRFWAGVALGLVAPALLAAWVPAAGGVLALAGLWLLEDAWVRAGQSVPLS
jgi:hypothetical protein